MYPVIKVALPKCGIVSVIGGNISNGPGRSGGARSCPYIIIWLSLYHYMRISRTSLLVAQLFRDTPLGCIIKFCIADLVMDT